jgi:molecular chaperone DnaK (HSP70)
MKELYPWVSVGVVVVGFLAQAIFGSFRLGQAVGEVKAALKKQIDDERDKIVEKIDGLEEKFISDQKTQDHNFGEVGAAVRQYIADVEKKVRENEIWGRDNFVQKSEFLKATDRLEAAIKEWGTDIKADLRDRIDDLRKSFEGKH